MSITQDKIIKVIIVVLLLSAVFCFLGIYNTNALPLLQRFFLWVSTISAATLVASLVIPWVFGGPLSRQNIALKLVVLSMIVSIPTVFVVVAINGDLDGDLPLASWLSQYLRSFVISILINTAAYFSIKAAGWIPDTDSAEKKNGASIDEFLKRLPIKYRDSKLYAISSEDHYLRVHTDLGEELILMRLSDALKELSEVDGLQAHRSWWVARNGIADTISKNGKHTFVLKTGTQLPVSRSFSKAVRDANYF